MNRKPRRLFSSLATALLAAFGIAFAAVRAQTDTPPDRAQTDAPRDRERAPAAPALARVRAPADRSGAEDADYPLSRLQALSEVIREVDRQYVDPRRIDPKAMVIAAMDGVERAVAEVMSEGDAATGRLQVTVGSARQEFDLSSMKTIFDVRVVLGDVIAFVQKNLSSQKNLRDVEIAAVNGLLSTLDPHTMLYDPRGTRDLETTTRGEFGGLGFGIQMRDGNLTVLRVFKNTPAQRAGIKAKDVISRIEEQSTVNMDVQEAVDKLRGKPGTRVSISISRSGWAEPKKLNLIRDRISVESISQAKLLAGQIGYVRVSQFSGNTRSDLLAAIQAQRAQAGGALRGLVLDLRNNPGGVLEQAVQVTDLFLSEGPIVKTVGNSGAEVKEAHSEREDMTSLPLVILVNNSSASASEIVAGALKNDNRALVVGRQTFGKGSVQMLHKFPSPGNGAEDLSLKLTVAQYLTPGDLSIQEVGITPDVLLVPGRALKGTVNFFAPPRTYGEVDLDRHLANPTEMALSPVEAARRAAERAARTEKASLELHYLRDEQEDQVAKELKADERREAAAKAHEPEISPEQLEDEEVEASPDQVVEDFPIRFARELLALHPYADRPRLLEAARLLVADKQAEEAARLEQKLAQLGVDWSAPPAQGSPRALVTVSPPPGKKVAAGETLPWTVTVENKGNGPFRRLRAWAVVQRNTLLDHREFVFGLVKPGEKRTWTTPVKLPKGMDSRHDEVKLHFEDEGGNAPPDVAASVDVAEVQKPVFAFSAQFDDDEGGNGDGDLQRGEEVTLRVDVKNEGAGPSGDRTYVAVKNLADDKIFIRKGRAVIGSLKPGESRSASLQLEVRKGYKDETVPLRILVHDEKLDEFVSQKLEVPVAREAPARVAARGAVRVLSAQATVRAGADPASPPLALAKKGTLLPAQARYGDAVRVEWQKGRFGFVSHGDVAPAEGKAPASAGAAEVWQHEPPRIVLSPDPLKGAPVVDGERLRVEGHAAAPGSGKGRLRDLFIFVNEQKVFFKVAPEGSATRLDFAADVPLKPGNNVVTVFAREGEEFQAHRSFVAHRRIPEVASQSR